MLDDHDRDEKASASAPDENTEEQEELTDLDVTEAEGTASIKGGIPKREE